MTSDSQPLDQRKAALRAAALARRDAIPAAERQAAADTIAARPFPLPIPAGAIVSGFMPLKSEINPLPLLRRLADAGIRGLHGGPGKLASNRKSRLVEHALSTRMVTEADLVLLDDASSEED